jgi:hypothetical protein
MQAMLDREVMVGAFSVSLFGGENGVAAYQLRL